MLAAGLLTGLAVVLARSSGNPARLRRAAGRAREVGRGSPARSRSAGPRPRRGRARCRRSGPRHAPSWSPKVSRPTAPVSPRTSWPWPAGRAGAARSAALPGAGVGPAARPHAAAGARRGGAACGPAGLGGRRRATPPRRLAGGWPPRASAFGWSCRRACASCPHSCCSRSSPWSWRCSAGSEDVSVPLRRPRPPSTGADRVSCRGTAGAAGSGVPDPTEEDP